VENVGLFMLSFRDLFTFSSTFEMKIPETLIGK